MYSGWNDVHLREAHCGFGLPQSIQILFFKSSLLMSSWSSFFASVWSIATSVSVRGLAALKFDKWSRNTASISLDDVCVKCFPNLNVASDRRVSSYLSLHQAILELSKL